VSAPKGIDTRFTATKQTITSASGSGNTPSGPVDNLKEAAGKKTGVAPQASELHFRGAPSPTPAPPAGRPHHRRHYAAERRGLRLHVLPDLWSQPFVATDEDSLSTFAVGRRRRLLTPSRAATSSSGHLPPAEAVRVEEFVNYFPQGYPKFENDDFRILVDGAPSPFGRGYHLLRIGIKGREIDERNRKPARLTFVIDVSGSMDRENRLGLVKRALRVMVDRLRDDDRIGIVVFGTTAARAARAGSLGESVAMVAGVYRPADDDEARGSMSGGRASWPRSISSTPRAAPTPSRVSSSATTWRAPATGRRRTTASCCARTASPTKGAPVRSRSSRACAPRPIAASS
jgi:hypothetical protein